MPKLTQEIKDKVKATHAGVELHILRNPAVPADGEAIARGPSRNEWYIFKQKAGSEAEKTTAYQVLLPCILWPEQVERERLFELYPALAEVWCGELTEIAGSTRQGSHEKL